MFSDSKYLLPNPTAAQPAIAGPKNRGQRQQQPQVLTPPEATRPAEGRARGTEQRAKQRAAQRAVCVCVCSNCLKNGRRTLKFTKCIYYGTKSNNNENNCNQRQQQEQQQQELMRPTAAHIQNLFGQDCEMQSATEFQSASSSSGITLSPRRPFSPAFFVSISFSVCTWRRHVCRLICCACRYPEDTPSQTLATDAATDRDRDRDRQGVTDRDRNRNRDRDSDRAKRRNQL